MQDQTHLSRESGLQRRKRGAVGLGRTQRLVLRLLALDTKSVRNLSYDWPTLTESAAYGAVMRLADRGLVDMAGWEHEGGRTYCLTAKGREVEASLNRDEFDLDEDDDDA